MIELDWVDFKKFVDDRSLKINWVDLERRYLMIAIDGPLQFKCIMNKNTSDAQGLNDFETQYKSSGNEKLDGPITLNPFASKKIGSKSLFTRVHGTESELVIGTNNVDFVIPYAQAKFNALEIVNAEVGDKVSLKVLDSSTGSLTTVPYMQLNQFGFEINLPDGFYKRESQYDADLVQGLIIRLEYTTAVAKTVRFNVVLHELK